MRYEELQTIKAMSMTIDAIHDLIHKINYAGTYMDRARTPLRDGENTTNAREFRDFVADLHRKVTEARLLAADIRDRYASDTGNGVRGAPEKQARPVCGAPKEIPIFVRHAYGACFEFCHKTIKSQINSNIR